MEPTEVTVQLIPEDVRRFNKHCHSRAFPQWASIPLFVVAIALFATFQFLNQPSGRSLSQATPDLVVSIFPLVVFIVIFILFRWFAFGSRRLKRAMPDAFLPRLYRLSADGIYEETKTSQTTRKWAGIVRMDETNDYLFFMVAPRRGLVIPKRCFHPPDTAAVFANQARVFLEANKEKPEQQA